MLWVVSTVMVLTLELCFDANFRRQVLIEVLAKRHQRIDLFLLIVFSLSSMMVLMLC
mgnify:CR=1 FL=1